jgi:hypothetical protein
MRAVISRAVASGAVTIETGKSQFVFYPPIFVYILLMSGLLELSLLLLPIWTWAHGLIALSMGCAGIL